MLPSLFSHLSTIVASTRSFALLASEKQIPLNSEPFLRHHNFSWFTNSIAVELIVLGLILWLTSRATSKVSLVPNRFSQNFVEAVIESIYNLLEGIVGKHMVKKAFPLLATFFIFILASNIFGLVPGVGTIGWGNPEGPFRSIEDLNLPLLRPANADLNLTLAMAVLFMFFWLVWSVQNLGVGGFFSHIFGAKGDLPGFLKIPLGLLFAFVGVIEVISIMFRPVSLSLRLFGNIYAGENLLHTMVHLGDALPAVPRFLMSILIPVPFYFLEILVALVQALVFTLLCAVYIQLMAPHHEDDYENAGHQHHSKEALSSTGTM